MTQLQETKKWDLSRDYVHSIFEMWSTPDFNFPLAKFKIWSTPDFHLFQQSCKIWSTPDFNFPLAKF